MSDKPMPVREYKYVCDRCKADVGRDNLTAKRVAFNRVRDNKTIKSRTVAWLCKKCLSDDPDWTLPIFGSSPGFRGTKRDPESH